jgi:hypothetical protein
MYYLLPRGGIRGHVLLGTAEYAPDGIMKARWGGQKTG